MNSLHFFAFYNARGFFQQFKNERMDNYFKDIFHRGMIHRSLIEYRKKGAPFYPLQVLDSMLPPEQKHVLGQVRPYLLQIARPGFLFFEE